MKYTIGSKAIKNIFPNFKREPKDIDYLVESKIENNKNSEGIMEEYHVIPPLYNYVSKNEINKDVLLTLKTSHIFWDIKWEKNMFDIVFLRENGAALINSLFEELYKYWNNFHGENKRSQLDMSAKDFFNNALKKYDHDLLHTFITPTPTYFKVLKDGADVEVDLNKFEKLSFEEKCDLAREEIYVMAFERLAGRDYRVAYSWMLKKFIISHAPLPEALFIIENYRLLHKK